MKIKSKYMEWNKVTMIKMSVIIFTSVRRLFAKDGCEKGKQIRTNQNFASLPTQTLITIAFVAK